MKSVLRRIADAPPVTVAVALVASHLVLALLVWDPAPHGGGDNTAYLSLARSLLENGRMLEVWDPARPVQTQYPPGFPLLLAAAWSMGLQSWAALKLMMLAFSGAAVGLSYLWMRDRTAPTIALGLGLLLAYAPGILAESGWVLTDVPFWGATMAALLALGRGRTGWGIALAFLALTLRTAGLPLLVAIAVWLAWRRRWPAALGVLVGLAAGLVLWSVRAPETVPYVTAFWMVNPYIPAEGTLGLVDFVDRVLENGERYGFRFLMRALTGSVGLIGAVGGAVLIAAAAVGFWTRLRGRVDEAALQRHADPTPTSGAGSRAPGLVEIFTVLYVGMLLAWPEQWASDRFLLPLVPVLLVYGAEALGGLPVPSVARLFRSAGLAALVGLGLPPLLTLGASAAACRGEVEEVGVAACRPGSHQAFLELAQWTEGRLPDDAVIISRKPRQWYWFSGYPGRVYPFTSDGSAVLELAGSIGARYLVLDELGGTSVSYLMPAVLEQQYRYCAIQRVQREGRAATLLGILPEEWDPTDYGLDDASEAGSAAVRLPVCPPAFRAGTQ